MIRRFMSGQHSGSGGVQISSGDVHFIANRLRRYFAPASVLPPPGIPRGSTGNRNVSITSNASPNYTPNDQATIHFKGGVAVWRFTTKFQKPPICKATAIGQLAPGGTPEVNEIYLQGPGTNQSIIFHSSDPNDNRFLHVHAAGNPN